MQLAFHNYATLRQCLNQDAKDKHPVLPHIHKHKRKKVKRGNVENVVINSIKIRTSVMTILARVVYFSGLIKLIFHPDVSTITAITNSTLVDFRVSSFPCYPRISILH